MSGLSLMQTRSFIDRLGDLDEEITKVCRASDVMAKGVGKDHSDGVGRLKEACDALQEKQSSIREAKDCLLGFDGFMHALSGEMRGLMEHPTMGSAISRISDRMVAPMESQVTTIMSETVDGLRRVAAAVAALREAKEDAKRAGSIQESAKALSKICDAAENALRKALKHAGDLKAEEPEEAADMSKAPKSGDAQVVVEEVVEKKAGDTGFHGYELTAGELPDFIKEKMEEKDKDGDEDDDDKKSSKKADSLTPGNESKGPKDEGEEDEGWVPGHRTKSDKKAKGKVPEAFLKNIEKMKAKGKGKDGDDDKDDAKDSGKPWEKDKKAGYHGYTLTEPSNHGYKLDA